MAKEARTTFEGEGLDRVMVRDFPAIGKVLRVPIGKFKARYGDEGYEHGMKQRCGDFGALPKEWSEAEKNREEFRRASAWVAHLESGGDWKMSGDRDTSAIVCEALHRLNPRKYTKAKLAAAIAKDPEAHKVWRKDDKVKATIAAIYAERSAAAAADAETPDFDV